MKGYVLKLLIPDSLTSATKGRIGLYWIILQCLNFTKLIGGVAKLSATYQLHLTFTMP